MILGQTKPFQSSCYNIKEHKYDMRNATIVQPSFKTLKYGFRSLRYSGAMLYNNIPNEFRLSNVEDLS